MMTRAYRSTEPRFHGFRFADEPDRFLWDSLRYMDFPILVPHRPGRHSLADKEARIRQRHRLGPDVPLVFVEAELGDTSRFDPQPLLQVQQEDGRFVIRVTDCASIPHAIAAVALELSRDSAVVPEVHFGWSDESPLTANLHFVLYGHGNVPWMVQTLLRRAEPDEKRRPPVVIG
jgi:hypothetical protein